MQDVHRTNRPTRRRPPDTRARSTLGPLAVSLATLDAADRHHAGVLRRFDASLEVPARAQPARVRRSRWRARYTRVVVIGDLAAAPAATALVGAAPRTLEATALTVVAAAVALTVLALAGGYQHRFIGTGAEEFRRLLACGTLAVAVADTLAYAAGPGAERVVVLAAPVAVALAVAQHLLARGLLHRLRRRGLLADRVLALGLERSVAGLVHATRRDPGAGLRVVGTCVRQSSGPAVEGVPVLGPPEAAVDALRTCHADTVVLAAWSDVGEDDLRRLAWQLEGTGVQLLVAPRVAEVALTRLHLRPVGGVPLLRSRSRSSPARAGWRRRRSTTGWPPWPWSSSRPCCSGRRPVKLDVARAGALPPGAGRASRLRLPRCTSSGAWLWTRRTRAHRARAPQRARRRAHVQDP